MSLFSKLLLSFKNVAGPRIIILQVGGFCVVVPVCACGRTADPVLGLSRRRCASLLHAGRSFG